MAKSVDWTRVRRIVLNDRLIGYKPDMRSLKTISSKLPDANVLGFGIYHKGYVSTVWYVTVESKFFVEDQDPGFISQSITSVPDFSGDKPKTVQIINGGNSGA